MTMTFRGGELDGEVHPIGPEDLFADWDPQQDAYLVSDEDGEPKGRIVTQTQEAEAFVQALSAMLRPKPNPRRGRTADIMAFLALAVLSAAGFINGEGEGLRIVFVVAWMLLWIAYALRRTI